MATTGPATPPKRRVSFGSDGPHRPESSSADVPHSPSAGSESRRVVSLRLTQHQHSGSDDRLAGALHTIIAEAVEAQVGKRIGGLEARLGALERMLGSEPEPEPHPNWLLHTGPELGLASHLAAAIDQRKSEERSSFAESSPATTMQPKTVQRMQRRLDALEADMDTLAAVSTYEAEREGEEGQLAAPPGSRFAGRVSRVGRLEYATGVGDPAGGGSTPSLGETRSSLDALLARVNELDGPDARRHRAALHSSVDAAAQLGQHHSESLRRLSDSIEATRAELAGRADLERVSSSVAQLRSELVAGGGSLGGGGGRGDMLGALRAAQQQTQAQLLSLHSTISALLRQTEAQREAGDEAESPADLVGTLRSEVHAALAEVAGEVKALRDGKADCAQVDDALRSKADSRLLAAKADRSFCEALLARFSVEVGKQLGDMETSHHQLEASLQASLKSLMATASDAAVRADVADEPLRPWTAGAADGAAHGPGSPYSAVGYDASLRPSRSSQPAPLCVQPLDAGPPPNDASSPSLATPPRRAARLTSPSGHDALKPGKEFGKGVLPTSVLAIADASPATADRRAREFQPGRPRALLTPGEQAIARQRPASATAVRGSASSAALLIRSAQRRL